MKVLLNWCEHEGITKLQQIIYFCCEHEGITKLQQIIFFVVNMKV